MKGLIQSQWSISCSSLILVVQKKTTYSFQPKLFIQQYPLDFVSAGKFYQYKLGYEVES